MRLSSLSGKNQQYLLLGLDQPLVLASQLGLNLASEADAAQLESLLSEILAAYGETATGVMLSAELGYSALAAVPVDTGVAFCLERTLSETDPLSIPILMPNWSVEYVRNNQAVAKLSLHATSDEAELINKLELVNELYDSCQYEGIDFMLQLHVIDGKRLSDDEFQEQQLRLIRFFRGQSNILSLEYPRTPLGCLAVTGQVQTPWVMVEPAGLEYAAMKDALRNALTGGAVGMIATGCLLPAFPAGEFHLEAFRAYLQKEGRDRLLELSRICEEGMRT